MPFKTVFVNDVPVGHACSWGEVDLLLARVGISFVGKPGAAEGPTGFFIYGSRATSRERRPGVGHIGPG